MTFEKRSPPLLDIVSQSLLSQTPLHFACYSGDKELVDTLLGKTLVYNNNDNEAAGACVGAMICEEDAINGWTPAHWASYYGQLGCLTRLHISPSVGFDEASQRSNTSPLHLAAQAGAVLCLKWLLQCGASINRQDFMGETPLHKAAKAGNTDSAAMLISHGSLFQIKNHRGCTAADLAELGGHPALADFLRRSMEQPPHGNIGGNQNTQLPISDLNLPDSSSFSRPAQTYSNPHHMKDSPFTSNIKQQQNQSLQPHPNVSMNGEHIYNGWAACPSAMEHCDKGGFGGSAGGMMECSAMEDQSSPAVQSSMKRSLDDMEDDEDGMMEDPRFAQFSKKRCFVPCREKSDEEHYGTATNNNVIASYNAVLAMRVEPMAQIQSPEPSPTRCKNSSPVLPQSSVVDLEECLMAQQGYDSSLACALLGSGF